MTNFKKLLVAFSALLATGGIFANFAFATTGSIWTTTSSCGQPQNSNHYNAGDNVFINGANFAVNTTYSWDITKVGGQNPPTVASGTQTTDSNGNICFQAYTIQSGDSGEYKATFDGKSDNYQVDASTTPTPTPTVSVTPSVSPSATPTVSVTPTATPSASPTVTVTPSESPTPTNTPVPTTTPTPGPSNNNGGPTSDGLSSCPSCTQAPKSSSAPIQAVLGTSTMASTGTFEQNTMNVMLFLGIISLGLGAKRYAKEKNA